MLALASVAHAGPVLHVSRTTVHFGYMMPGFRGDVEPVFVTNTGDAPLTLSALTLGGGSPQYFQVVGGTCQIGTPIAPGDRCRIDLEAFKANPLFGTAEHGATLSITGDGMPASTLIGLGMIEHGTQFVARHPDFTPDWLDFPPQAVGTTSPAKTFVIQNVEGSPMAMRLIVLSGGDRTDFTLVTDCVGRILLRNETCTATVRFAPTASGPRATELYLEYYSSSFTYRSVTGVATAGGPATVDVVEYYNAVLDHYFITWVAAEQANLDAGNTPTRWSRTGSSFRAFTTAQTGTSPVCRYYIPPGKGDSHFFGRGTVECNATGAANPTFILEDPQFMHLFLPVAGVCPAGTTPIYRVFSNRPDANHRYMTDRAIRDQMVARGWLAEGDGADLVVMCSA